MISKHLDLEDQGQLGLIADWIESLEGTVASDEKISFIQGFRTFIQELDKSFGEFERVIISRETTLKINERELNRVFDILKNEAEIANEIIERLRVILKDVEIAHPSNIGAGNSLDQGVKLIDMVGQVETLVQSNQESIQDLKILARIGFFIAKSKNLLELESNLNGSVKAFYDSDLVISIYINPNGDTDWTSSSEQVTSYSSLTDRYEEIFQILSAKENPIALMCLRAPDKDHKLMLTQRSRNQFAALMPIVRATLEIIGFVKEQAENLKVQLELETAKIVQNSFFPAPLFQNSNVKFAGDYIPASEVGGDWWFYFETPQKFFVCLGDVTGHGLSSALMTAAARSIFSVLEKQQLPTGKALELLNRALFETSKGSLQMTLVLLEIDFANKVITYSNAGHEAPMLMPSKGDNKIKDVQFLDEIHGPRLGEHLEFEYSQTQIPLKNEARLLIYSDGMREAGELGAMKGDRTFYNELLSTLNQSCDPKTVVLKFNQKYKFQEIKNDLKDDISYVILDLFL